MDRNLVETYRNMHPERLQTEIDSLFEHVHAVLEACDCISMDNFPDVNTKISIKCEMIDDPNQRFLC
jgi:hypothetical protein